MKKLHELKVTITLENGYEESNIVAIGNKLKLKATIMLIKTTTKKLLKNDPTYKNAKVKYEILEIVDYEKK